MAKVVFCLKKGMLVGRVEDNAQVVVALMAVLAHTG